MLGLYFIQLFCNVIISFIPGGRLQLPVSFDHRGTQSIRMVVKRKRISTLETSVTLVNGCIVRCLDRFYFIFNHGYFQVTAYTTIGTNGPDFFICYNSFGFKYIGDGRGGTSLRTGTTAHTATFGKSSFKIFDNVGIKASARHVEHHLTLYFVAGPDTTTAVDALGKIGSHVGMTQVLGPVEVVFTFGIPYFSDTYPGSNGLQLTIVVDFTGKTVERMIGQHQLNDVFTQLCHTLAISINKRIRYGRCVAGSLNLSGTSLCERNIHAAHPARTKRFEVGRITKGGHIRLPQMPAYKGQDGFSVFEFVGYVVDVSCFFHSLLCFKIRLQLF